MLDGKPTYLSEQLANLRSTEECNTIYKLITNPSKYVLRETQVGIKLKKTGTMVPTALVQQAQVAENIIKQTAGYHSITEKNLMHSVNLILGRIIP
ncbi:hypothetical protein CS542_04955 [Pedobacter sp. IW39]|nr:hypothetical protein CS542_04955 [Pedobacter sp. IW39]